MEPNAKLPSIDDLLAEARAGDTRAENELFERLHARILSLAKRKIVDQEAAQDIAQETMRTVFEKYRKADLSHGFLPWVMRILHNKVGNYLKRRRTEMKHMSSAEDDVIWNTVGVSPEGETRAIDLAESLEKALMRVTPECKKIFRLLLGGADRTEIHKAFGGGSQGTIDSRISRCREKLLRYMEELETERSP